VSSCILDGEIVVYDEALHGEGRGGVEPFTTLGGVQGMAPNKLGPRRSSLNGGLRHLMVVWFDVIECNGEDFLCGHTELQSRRSRLREIVRERDANAWRSAIPGAIQSAAEASMPTLRAVDAPAVGGWWSPPHTATREPTEYHHRTRRRSLHLEASLRLLHIHHPRYEAQNTAAEDGERRLREKLAAC
jgi:hypothetical protein